MEDAFAQRWSDDDSSNHCSEKQRPTDAQQHDSAMVAQKVQAFAHLEPEALKLGFSSQDIGAQLLGTQYHVASLPHGEIAKERNHVCGDVDQKHAAEADVVVHEADDRTGDEPSSLDAGQKKSIRLHELAFGREFLDEGGDGRPEHPEAGGDERVHQIELPNLYSMPKREDGYGHDDHGAQGVEPHNQAAAIFAVYQDAGEGKHEHGGDWLRKGQGGESPFRVRWPQAVPVDSRPVYPTTQTRNLH